MPISLFVNENLSGDLDGDEKNYDGGSKVVYAYADSWSAGTFEIQTRVNGGPWITATTGGAPATFSANAVAKLDRLGSGSKVRGVATGVTATNFNASLQE